jgi:hypothetical protein
MGTLILDALVWSPAPIIDVVFAKTYSHPQENIEKK